MTAGGNEVAGDDDVSGGDVREVERSNGVEAKSFSGAGSEKFEVWDIGFLNKSLFSYYSIELFGGLLEVLGLV